MSGTVQGDGRPLARDIDSELGLEVSVDVLGRLPLGEMPLVLALVRRLVHTVIPWALGVGSRTCVKHRRRIRAYFAMLQQKM